MIDQRISKYWWQRPQPVWVSSILSVMIILSIWGTSQLVGSLLAQEGNFTTEATSSGLIPYQGFLTNTDGQPLNGNQTIQVEIYNTSSGGSRVWGPETHTNVPVVNGLFNISLGSKIAGGIPSTVWDNSSLYLQVSVNGETLSPRESLFAPIRTWQLLGVKTANPTSTVTVDVGAGWQIVRGENATDYLETTVTTQGGLLMVNMTTRFQSATALPKWCGFAIYNQNGEFIRRVHLQGVIGVDALGFGCSGSLLVELPAGTYTFQAGTWSGDATTTSWTHDRQIAVFEYR
jgi:hypothetical protein